MKKLLAMVLALVMTLSLAVSASAVKADEKINEDYAEAVAVLNGMGVFKGYEDGSFKPENNITRAEVATIIYRIYTGDVAKNDKSGLYASYNKFTDMAGAGWAAGYIGYCSNAELVKGYPNGTFQPSGNITGYEVLAMILRAVGYDKNGEFTGADWALNVAKYAEQLDILKNVAKTTNLGAPATRELVAEILFRAINVPMVTYTAAFGYQNVGLNGDKDGKPFQNNVTLGKKNFDLKKDDKTADKFGRPTITWEYNTGDEKTVIAVKPLATFTEPAKNCEVYDESGLAKDTKLDVYTNSKDKDGTYVIADNKDDSKQAMQGRLTEVYKDRLVNVDTFLAEVEKAVAEKTDAKGHVTKAYVLVDEIYGFEGKFDDKFVTSDEFKADDMVLVTVADGKIQSMVKAENKAATLTKIKGNYKTIDKVADVMGLDKEDVKTTNTAAYKGGLEVLALSSTYNFYFDTYGNVIGADELASNYAVLDSLYIDRLDGKRGVDGLFGTPYFFNGEKAENVTIDEILGRDVSDKRIELTSAKNDDYYYTVYAYTIDKDGVYTFENSDFETVASANHKAGDKYITYNRGDNKLHLNKDSQILLQTKNSPNGTFVSYTGYEKLGNVALSNVQYKLDSLGYVTMLYAQAEEYSNRTVFVYNTTPSYSWVNDDGDKIATMKVLELVENEWKETTVDVYYGAQPAYGVRIFLAGLYELTEGQDGLWYADSYAPMFRVDNTYGTKDNFRVDVTNVKTGKQEYLELDDAKIVKYTGSFVKGEYDTEDWEAKKLSKNSTIFVQFNDDDEVVAVYDMYIEAHVNEKTGFGEFYGHEFKTVKVELKEYEKISTAVMEEYTDTSVDTNELNVKYFDKDGKEVTMDANKGTKVAYAELSYNDTVTGDIIYTVANQAAYINAALKEGNYNFEAAKQSITVAEGSITVNTNAQTVNVTNLKALLKAAALGTNYQTIEVYNTNDVELASGEVANDMYVKVTAWDGKTTATYQITVDANPVG